MRNFLDEGHARTLERIVFCNFLAKDEDAYHEFLPKYFPSADAVTAEKEDESAAEDGKTSLEHDDQRSKEKSLEEELPEVPSEEPVIVEKEGEGGVEQPQSKKLKASADDEDSDWEKVEKESVPQRASVEEVVDEEAGGRSKV